jgi:hypothetical protein
MTRIPPTVQELATYPMGAIVISAGVKLTTHLHVVSRLTVVVLYLHFPIRLNGIVLN